MTARIVSRLGDTSDHGGTFVTASSDVKAEGIGVVRHGDLHICPIPGHGITAMSSGAKTKIDGGRGVVRVGIDFAQCGAIAATGSPSFKSS